MELLSKISVAFSHGGIWMWPILIVQVASVSIVAERIYALFIKRKANQRDLVATYESDIRRAEIDGVIEKATMQADQPVSRAVLAGAKAAKFLGGKDEIQGKMDEVLNHENFIFDRRTAFLTMFGNVATLMGLLGTITGMIQSFAAVAYATPAEKATLLAERA